MCDCRDVEIPREQRGDGSARLDVQISAPSYPLIETPVPLRPRLFRPFRNHRGLRLGNVLCGASGNGIKREERRFNLRLTTPQESSRCSQQLGSGVPAPQRRLPGAQNGVPTLQKRLPGAQSGVPAPRLATTPIEPRPPLPYKFTPHVQTRADQTRCPGSRAGRKRRFRSTPTNTLRTTSSRFPKGRVGPICKKIPSKPASGGSSTTPW